MKTLIVTMLMLSTSAQAGWFGLGAKELTEKEKVTVETGICSCGMGMNDNGGYTFEQASREPSVIAFMKKLRVSLMDTYKLKTERCETFNGTPRAAIYHARKNCIAVYRNFGEDRSLKTEAETMK